MQLQNFASIFELLFAYNLGIAYSEKVRFFLGINENLSRLVHNHREFDSLHWLVQRFEEYHEAVPREKAAKIKAQFTKLSEWTSFLFDNRALEKFLKPFYVYFGVLAMFYLFFAGALEEQQDFIHLMALNLGSLIIGLVCLFGSFRLRRVPFNVGGVRSFFLSGLGIIALLMIRRAFIEDISFMEIGAIDLIGYIQFLSFENFQILAAVLLVFSPIIVELLHVFICVCRLRNMKRTYDQYVISVTPLIAKNIKNTTELPDASEIADISSLKDLLNRNEGGT